MTPRPTPSPPATLTASDLLATWERSRTGSPWQRAVVLASELAGSGDDAEASSWDIGSRDRLLLDLHLELFGDELDATASCGICGQEVEAALSVRMFLAEPATGSGGDPRAPLVVLHGASAYELRLPTSADVAASAALDPETARIALLSRCVPGAPPDMLGDRAFQSAVARCVAEADPCVDLLLNLSCPACGATWRAMFDIAEFLWHELDTWAHRVLYDVQLLAGAYGWSERDILALPPWRRQYYAEALGA